MNSLEILYQIYRARFSLTRVQEALDKGFKLILLGPRESTGEILGWLGERREDASTQSLPQFEFPLSDEALAALRDCDGVVVHVGKSAPDGETLRGWARQIPVSARCLWVLETSSLGVLDALKPDSATPRLYRLDPIDPGPVFLRLLLRFYPGLAINLARDFAQVRFLYSRALTRRASQRASVLAAASTLPVPPLPGINLIWGFFATTGETMAITAAQLRLCLLIAAIHGRPIDFFDRVGELWPIIGSAFGWRAVAREMVGLIPLAGWAMKSSLAYTGTWLVGEGSRLYYEHGQPTEGEELRELKRRTRAAAAAALAGALDFSDEDEPHDPPQAEEVK